MGLEKIRRALIIGLWASREILRTAWGLARQAVIGLLHLIAALIVLFEEWGWRPLHDAIVRLGRYAPVALIERVIAGLPPYAALGVFALPVLTLMPLKFVAVWLLANGKYWTASALFIGAKILSTALIARIFVLTQPALMRIGWFARAYTWFVPWKDLLFARIRNSAVWRNGKRLKSRITTNASRAWELMRPTVWPKIEAARAALRMYFERNNVER